MSHIVAHKSKIALINKSGIKTAIEMMKKEFTGIRCEEIEGMILIRGYAPIEVYQRRGNMRFILSEDKKAYEMHYDPWNCDAEVFKVRDAFYTNYQKAGALAFARKTGFTAGTWNKTKEGERMIAQKW